MLYGPPNPRETELQGEAHQDDLERAAQRRRAEEGARYDDGSTPPSPLRRWVDRLLRRSAGG